MRGYSYFAAFTAVAIVAVVDSAHAQQKPMITEVGPATVTIAPGKTAAVQVNGKHLTKATRVDVGNASVKFIVRGPMLVLTVPAGHPSGFVTVTTPEGTATSTAQLTVVTTNTP